jgi:hypothetical protein
MPTCREFGATTCLPYSKGWRPEIIATGAGQWTVRKPTGRLPAGRPNFECHETPAASRLAGTPPGAQKGVLHVWEQDIGVFPVNFAEQGDEWSYHLRVELTGDIPMGGRGTDGTAPVELGPPVSGPVHSKLLVSPHPDGISCTVTGDGDSAAPEQVDPWLRAAQAAVALLGARNRVFTWEAVVGVVPRGFEGRFGQLAQPQDVGPVHLVPGGICMCELVPSERTGSSGYRHTFPVIASGQVIAYEWGRVALAAEACLRRTCALLSLLTGAVWIPRSHPSERPDGAAPLQVPSVFGTVPPFPGETEWRGQIRRGTPEFTLPGWI